MLNGPTCFTDDRLGSASAPRPLRKARSGLVALSLLALAGACRQDMHDQPKYKPLRESEFFADKRSARPLVEGTVARGTLREDAAFFTGKDAQGFVSELPVQADAAAARARPHRVPGLLLSLPRPHRPRRRHDRAARLQEAELVPRRPTAPDADRLLLRRDHDRLRRDAGLRGADRPRGPLGDRRLRADAAVQPVRAGLGGSRGQARRARPQPAAPLLPRSTTREPRAQRRARAAPEAEPRRGRSVPAGARRGLPARPRAVLPLVPARLPVLGRGRRGGSGPLHAQPPDGRTLGHRAAPLPRSGRAHLPGARARLRPDRARRLLALPVGEAGGVGGGRAAPGQGALPQRAVLPAAGGLLLRALERPRLPAQLLVADAGRRAERRAGRVAARAVGHRDRAAVPLGHRSHRSTGACRSRRTGSPPSTGCCSS